jgi:hypothetical protein
MAALGTTDASGARADAAAGLTTAPLATNLHRSRSMSRAFTREDSGHWGDPGRRYHLPPHDDPEYDAAAAEALLEGAREGDTGSAESATGYYWGEPRLAPHVRRILERARRDGDERLMQVAERFLR